MEWHILDSKAFYFQDAERTCLEFPSTSSSDWPIKRGDQGSNLWQEEEKKKDTLNFVPPRSSSQSSRSLSTAGSRAFLDTEQAVDGSIRAAWSSSPARHLGDDGGSP